MGRDALPRNPWRPVDMRIVPYVQRYSQSNGLVGVRKAFSTPRLAEFATRQGP
jgi:hypothetical protein